MNSRLYVKVVVKQWNLKKTILFASKKGKKKFGDHCSKNLLKK